MAPTPSSGKRATNATRNPIAPSQWAKQRQNRMPRGKASTSGITLEPVPVKPLVHSNHALMGLRMPFST